MPTAALSVPWRSFEALLLAARPAPPGLLEALRALGVDPSAPQEHYSWRVWREVLEATRAHLFPHLGRARGLRELGLHFVQGFVRTLVGRVLASAARSLSPERILARLPGYLRAGVEGLPVEMETLSACTWRARVGVDGPFCHFASGVVLGILQQVRLPAPCVTVAALGPHTFELLISWQGEAQS